VSGRSDELAAAVRQGECQAQCCQSGRLQQAARSAVALEKRRHLPAQLIQLIKGDQRPAILVFNRVKLEPGTSVELAAIGHGILDRRKFEKVILAFAWSGEQQQHEPNGLQRVPPSVAPVVGRRKPCKQFVIILAGSQRFRNKRNFDRCAAASI
jgi:hypothetical protein